MRLDENLLYRLAFAAKKLTDDMTSRYQHNPDIADFLEEFRRELSKS